jgi:hypothetical protein
MAFAPPAPELAPDHAPSALTPAAWDRLTRSIKLYSWAQVVFLATLTGSLHLFPLLGKRWSSCLVTGTGETDWWRVLFFHLYEIPLAVLFAYHAYYGFKKVTRATLPYYSYLTLFQVVILFVFVTFESKTLLDAMAHPAEAWEIAVIFGGCTGMLVDTILGFYIVFSRILPAYIATLRAGQV